MRNSCGFRPAKALCWTGLGLIAAVLTACGGGGGDGSAQQGTLKLAMTDAPACGYDHVYVTVTKIRVHQSATAGANDAGWSELAIAPQRIDLLNLTNGVLQELGSLPLPAGHYQQIRLVLADNPSNPTPANPLANALVLSGATNEIALTTPSGQQSGFKLKANFDVTGGQVADMVLDFDACKSVVKAGGSGNYNLKPVVAVIKRLTTEIVGYVSPALASSVVVSTRDPDNNLRATVPNATTGKFVLAYLPENTNYTVTVAGKNLTTAAVTGIPVSIAAGTTTLNTSAAPIALAASTSATVSGTVTNTSNTPLTDAAVNAQQVLSAGQKLDVAWTQVDPSSAAYSLTLPLAAPIKASYVASGPLVFTADAAVAGKYNILGSAPGYTVQNTAPAVTLTTANSVTSMNLVLAP
ncbi:lipoprotein [Comamonas phosphati]|nr:lipoprotein [Comamonas phosphati]